MIQAVFIIHQDSKIIFFQPISSSQFTPKSEIVAGFLTAIAAFTKEIRAGNIEYLQLENAKFVYKSGKQELLYVLAVDKDDNPEEGLDRLRHIRRAFEEKYAVVLRHALENGADFSEFSKTLENVLKNHKE